MMLKTNDKHIRRLLFRTAVKKEIATEDIKLEVKNEI